MVVVVAVVNVASVVSAVQVQVQRSWQRLRSCFDAGLGGRAPRLPMPAQHDRTGLRRVSAILQRPTVAPRHRRRRARVPASVYHRAQSHRHRIDKYLDALLANQPISDREATDHCQKVAPQDGGLSELSLIHI